MTIFIRSLIFNFFFFSWLAIISIFAGTVSYFCSREYLYKVAKICGQGQAFLCKYLVNLKYEVQGLNNLPKDNQYIIASKHQSTWETLMIATIFNSPVIMMKKELMYIPFFGQAVKKSGAIFINRNKRKTKIEQLFEGAQNSINNQCPVFIFPEGHRTKVDSPPKYKYGIAKLYEKLNVPVVPVALNSGYFWGRRSFIKKPGKIVVKILPLILPKLGGKKFLNILEQEIENATKEISSTHNSLKKNINT